MRWLVCTSIQNLCRFIHNVSYATCIVISTLIAAQCIVWLSIQRVFSPVLHNLPTLLLQLNIPFDIFLLNLLFTYVYAYVYIYIAHCIGRRQVDKLFVHCNLLHEHFYLVQFNIGSLPCLAIAVRQCSRHTVSITCFTAETLVNVEILSYMHCYKTLKKKSFF